MRTSLYIVGLVASVILGAACALKQTVIMPAAASAPQKPAYLVASWDVLHPDQMKPFADAVIPLAKRAGFEMLAASEPQVLEGHWPYKGDLIVERYDSWPRC